MKNIFFSTLIIALTGILLSFQHAFEESDLIGSWKVKSIIKSSGKRKKGDKIITFTEDHQYISRDIQSDESRNGTWFYDLDTQELRCKMATSEDWEVMNVEKLTHSKLILTAEGKTMNLVKK